VNGLQASTPGVRSLHAFGLIDRVDTMILATSLTILTSRLK
jgi:hypothetical protein